MSRKHLAGRETSTTDPRRAAIARFAAACADDPLVVAAFLGGSFAGGLVDDFSDLDLYVVTEEEDYGDFFARRESFVRAWGDPVFVDTTVNFEGFGFDMLHFVFRDGVTGEVALGHRNNLLALHGGPHEVLVDKAGVLDGVVFPLGDPSEADRDAELRCALTWFWLDVIALAKALGRHRLAAAQQALTAMRGRCASLLAAAGVTDPLADPRLLATYVIAEPDAIAAAADELITRHRREGAHVAAANRLPYPEELAEVAEAHLRRASRGSDDFGPREPSSS